MHTQQIRVCLVPPLPLRNDLQMHEWISDHALSARRALKRGHHGNKKGPLAALFS